MMLQADTNDWVLRTAQNRDEMWSLAEDEGIREARLTYPSGWLFLTRDATTRELVRLAATTGGAWRVEELADELDRDTERVTRSVDDLVELRVFTEDDETVRPNAESIVARTVRRLGTAADEHGASNGFQDVASPEAVRLLVDALLSMDADDEFTQDDLHEVVGLPRKTVWMNVERLTELNVLVEDGDRYRLDDESSVFGHVRALDAAVLGTALSP